MSLLLIYIATGLFMLSLVNIAIRALVTDEVYRIVEVTEFTVIIGAVVIFFIYAVITLPKESKKMECEIKENKKGSQEI